MDVFKVQNTPQFSRDFDFKIWFRARKVAGSFEKRAPGSYKIYALPIFNFLVDRFHWNIDYLKNTFYQISTFSINWCNFFYIDKINGSLVKRQFKMLGMVQKNTGSKHL